MQVVVVVADLHRSTNPATIRLEVVEPDLDRFFGHTVRTETRQLQGAAACHYLGFQSVETEMPVRSCGDRVHDAWVERAIRDQRPTTLLRHGDELLLQCFLVDVAEVDLEEFHASDLLQLFLDSATCFQRILEASAYCFLVVVLAGIEQLQQP